jgi:hypothetical protein
MTKVEIISQTLKNIGVSPTQGKLLFDGEQDEEAFIISVLRDVLPEGDIKTCEDFRHLEVDCCNLCHEHSHYDMSVIKLPDGEKAWVCGSVKSALFPSRSIAKTA